MAAHFNFHQNRLGHLSLDLQQRFHRVAIFFDIILQAVAEIMIAPGNFAVSKIFLPLGRFQKAVLVHHIVEIRQIVVLDLRTKDQPVVRPLAENRLAKRGQFIFVVLAQFSLVLFELVVERRQKQTKSRQPLLTIHDLELFHLKGIRRIINADDRADKITDIIFADIIVKVLPL